MDSLSVTCPKCSLPFVAAASSLIVSQNPTRFHKVSFLPNHSSFVSGSSVNSSSSRSSSRSFGVQLPCKQCSVWKVQAQGKEVAAKESLNSGSILEPISSNGKLESTDNQIPDAEAISEFMTQVSDLVKLVDSRDIVELQLKQLDCEILIRKKEAMPQPQPPAAAPVYQMAPPMQHSMAAPAQAMAPATAAPAPSAPAPSSPAPAKPSASSHPPFKCPMAGTFYRCSGPGEPPFVKVGDKVQKGQVICIIEAMKLMNEIEADQSGTVAEVIAEDGKPVSVDTPLFVIVP